jgi:hypothetical protein
MDNHSATAAEAKVAGLLLLGVAGGKPLAISGTVVSVA